MNPESGKLKNKEKECPYCGIDIKDYLYNN